MTDLKKTVRRVTIGRRREKSKARPMIVSLEPGDLVGVRLQGTRQTYRISIEGVYEYALRQHLARIDKRARQNAKSEGLRLRSATAKARKELKDDLK